MWRTLRSRRERPAPGTATRRGSAWCQKFSSTLPVETAPQASGSPVFRLIFLRARTEGPPRRSAFSAIKNCAPRRLRFLYELSCLYSKNPGAAAAETHDRLPRSMRKAADWRGSSSFCAVSGRSLFLRLILWRLILASQRQAFGRSVFGRADLHVAAVMTDSEDRPLADALVRQPGRHDDAGMPIGNDLMDLEAALDEPAAEPHLL